jgi:small multidrug resistance pump
MQSLIQALLLAGAIVLEVGGTLSLRAADGFAKPLWNIPVAIGYLGAFTLLSLVLKAGMPVGVAYAIWAAVGVVLTAVLAHFIFHDPLTWLMGLGIALIVGGVVVVELGVNHA